MADSAAGPAREEPSRGVAAATFKKFQRDGATRLAALLGFWAFFSIFPLFLLLVSVLGFALPASDKTAVLHHVAALFPLLDPSTVSHLSGSVWSIVLGGVTALWSGTAVMRSAEFAFNSVWEVPPEQRPKMKEQLLRALRALLTIGLGLVVSTVVSGYVTGQASGVGLGPAGRIGGYLVALALDIGLFLAAFRMLTDRAVSLKELLPGALLSGVAFFVLEEASSFIISRRLQHAQATYGHFATVITVLWWFYLQGIVTMLGAELNTVLRARRVGGPPDALGAPLSAGSGEPG